MRFFITLLMIGLPAFLSAQDILKVKHYGVDQGLPQSTVWDIQQDHYGFLWVSTADGLCRFDGYTFNTYRHHPDDSLSIGGNTTHLISLDKQGDLWLTSDKGFDKYSSASGVFKSMYKYDRLRSSLFNKTIGEDNHGYVWVWIGGEGLLKFNKTTNQLAEKFTLEGAEAWRNNQSSMDAWLDKDRIWMTQYGSPALISFNTVTEKFQLRSMDIEIRALCPINDSIMLIGTPKGLLRFNTTKDTFEELFFPQPQSKLSPVIHSVLKIIQTNADEFWVATYNGIYVYHDQQRIFSKHYTSFSGGKDNYMVVQTLFMDKSGNIWIGTNGDGLKKYSPKAQPWKHYKSSSDRGDIVKSIYADGHDLVYIGYFNNGFDVFSKTKGFIRKIRRNEAPWTIPTDNPYAIMGINESQVFISFQGATSGFGVYDFKNQTFKNLTAEILKKVSIQDLSGNLFPVAIPYDEGSLLFNSKDALLQANFDTNTVPEFTLLHKFENELINSVFVDSQKTIWLGTMNGYYVKPVGGDWRKGTASLSKQVKTICEDAEGKIWMGTTSGLYILTKAGIIEKTLHADDSLINDFIYGILRDNRDDMWFSHNKGLTRFDHEKKTFRNFSVDDGLQSNEFNTGAYYKSTSGELFFGGINGANSFYPEDIKDNHQIPSVQITRIDLNDKPYLSDTVYWAQKKLTLDYTQNTLGFEFAGLEFTDPGKNQYAWRMSNIDKDWVFSGNKRFTRYANIPPGEYRFEVKASNNDGVWNETPRVLQIEIIPPFWQTWWFKIAMITVALGITAVIATLISRQRYHRKLMALEVQQKIQLDRDRISRELHDMVGSQLSLISSNLDWVSHPLAPLSDTERNKRLEEVSNMSKDVINNLRETIWALKKQEISFSDFTDKLKVIAHQQIDITPATRLEFNDEGTDELILGAEEALHLLRICQEAIHNTVKHAHMSKLEISWHSAHGHYEIRIKDNGQGFHESGNHNEHYGLENMKQRAAEIHADFHLETIPGLGSQIKISK